MVGDYISREALRSRVDEIIKTNHLRPDYVWFTPNGVKVLALEIPAANVVEVVRCRDCKHYNAGFECLIEGYGIERPADYFCADGERKDGGQDE